MNQMSLDWLIEKMSVENVDPCVDRPNIIKLRSVILSIMLETGYAEVDIENAMSINGD